MAPFGQWIACLIFHAVLASGFSLYVLEKWEMKRKGPDVGEAFVLGILTLSGVLVALGGFE